MLLQINILLTWLVHLNIIICSCHEYVNKVLSTPYNLGPDHFGMDAPFKMIDFVLVRFLVPDWLGWRLLSDQYAPFKPDSVLFLGRSFGLAVALVVLRDVSFELWDCESLSLISWFSLLCLCFAWSAHTFHLLWAILVKFWCDRNPFLLQMLRIVCFWKLDHCLIWCESGCRIL